MKEIYRLYPTDVASVEDITTYNLQQLRVGDWVRDFGDIRDWGVIAFINRLYELGYVIKRQNK